MALRVLTGTISAISGISSTLAAAVAGVDAVTASRAPSAQLFSLGDTIARRSEYDNPAILFENPQELEIVAVESTVGDGDTLASAAESAMETAVGGAGQGFAVLTMEDTDDKHADSDYWTLGDGAIAGVGKTFTTFQSGEPHFLSVLRQDLKSQSIALGQSVAFKSGSSSNDVTRRKFSAESLKERILSILDTELDPDNGEAKRDVWFLTNDNDGTVSVYWGSTTPGDLDFADVKSELDGSSTANIEAFKLTPVDTSTGSSGTGRIRR